TICRYAYASGKRYARRRALNRQGAKRIYCKNIMAVHLDIFRALDDLAVQNILAALASWRFTSFNAKTR
ncbi:MAG TPA: hypothetical protein VN448_11240, partial [Gammaproteobacteria bacterium]|nr:hypothetical protein [Gammaproteobacteria bacterium]